MVRLKHRAEQAPSPFSWAPRLPAYQLGSSGNRAATCISVAIAAAMATAHCHPGKDALPTSLQNPDSGMQPLNSSFYLLPTCSRLYKTENLLGVPHIPGYFWTRLICIKADREMGFMRLCRTAEREVNHSRGLSAWQGYV